MTSQPLYTTTPEMEQFITLFLSGGLGDYAVYQDPTIGIEQYVDPSQYPGYDIQVAQVAYPAGTSVYGPAESGYLQLPSGGLLAPGGNLGPEPAADQAELKMRAAGGGGSGGVLAVLAGAILLLLGRGRWRRRWS